MSIPHISIHLSLAFKFPKLPVKILMCPTIDVARICQKSSYSRGHYWEVGTKEVSYKHFRDLLLDLGFKIEKEFRNPVHPYHHFFILRVRR